MEALHRLAWPLHERRWSPRAGALVCTAALALAAVGCDGGDPRCSCEPRSVEILDVPVGGRRGASFTVTNSGDGGRLSWFIEPVYQSTLGLGILEKSSVYVLEEGRSADFTLLFRPTKSIADTTVAMRVGLDDCVIDVRLSAADFPPECTVTAAVVEFETAVGDTTERVVHVINTGGGRVSGTVAPLGCAAPFSVIPQRTSFNLAPGDSNAIRILHAPVVATGDGATEECSIGLGTTCAPIVVRGVATAPARSARRTQR